MGAPSIVIAASDGFVPVLDAAMAASARSYTTTFSNNMFVADWKSDYNGRIEIADLNAAFSEMTELALKRQKAQRSQSMFLLIYVALSVVLNMVGVLVFMTTDSIPFLIVCAVLGSICVLVGVTHRPDQNGKKCATV